MKGFTLVELLVVITIIAFLSTIGFVMYGQFTKSARDARRQSDLKFIQSALEDFHADQLYYPQTVVSGSKLELGSRIYMTEVPKDPIASQSYFYDPSGCASSKCTGYCLYSNMEGTAPRSDGTCTKAEYNYGVTRP